MTDETTAADFQKSLVALATPEQRQKYTRYFPGDDSFIGVRMGDVFALAGRALAMPLPDIETLLESPTHEVRVGACSIMGKAATDRKTGVERREELYELYLRRHDRIDTWDLVDLVAYQVVGGWLVDKPRDPLYSLAASSFWPERRTAMVATAAFLRRGDITDTLQLARMLGSDENDYVQKATGWMLRYLGDVDRDALLGFLDDNAAGLPRLTLRAATEKLDKPVRAGYLARKL
ncbi:MULTISPECIES: DNA alkylation repair protein [unclassified Cryobacterium]|uniref:DNA alkylation repair protein n=1 Tax=unclassified Cryobacterium TaxID=2649013 RepID=UPI00106AA1C4|nr:MULTISPECIES: DNA alkylation repair protein [unclassified Cryobacterium]TFC52269.1 DNA alkylation repair protein [Cryobacterium sp. TMB3-1-2]TFC69765.1 DNA alkylation repair protein [Cryobacterium sp. TMB3-15]TFC79080.1 DNA alkylation repair protein [Cryobacterium sp. TMB3-10]TFD39091.1 DNA alkylation repair protein [Cryobacterium sp. TMB3-12]